MRCKTHRHRPPPHSHTRARVHALSETNSRYTACHCYIVCDVLLKPYTCNTEDVRTEDSRSDATMELVSDLSRLKPLCLRKINFPFGQMHSQHMHDVRCSANTNEIICIVWHMDVCIWCESTGHESLVATMLYVVLLTWCSYTWSVTSFSTRLFVSRI